MILQQRAGQKLQILGLGEALQVLPRGGAAISWLLRDDFTDTLAAGSVNGTPATPGPGTRVVVDTNLKLSVGGGNLVSITGGFAEANPGLWYSLITRALGQMLFASVTPPVAASNSRCHVGWDSNQAGAPYDALRFSSSSTIHSYSGGISLAVGSWASSQTYNIVIVQRLLGNYYFIKGGAFTNWTLLRVHTLLNLGVYPSIGAAGTDGPFTADFIRVPTNIWLPTPICYDSFNRADGALGNTETSGPDGATQPCSALAWTGATWMISTLKAINTPTLGGDLITNGNFASDEPPGTAWTRGAGWTISGGVGVATAAAADKIMSQTVLTSNGWARVDWDTITKTEGYFRSQIGGTTVYIHSLGVGSHFDIWRATTTQVGIRTDGASTTGTIDNFVAKMLTLSSLFASLVTSSANVVVSVNITMPNRSFSVTQAGLVLNLDSAASPDDFIIAYHDGTNVHLDECVNGTYTSKINTAASYVANATLMVVRDGTACRVYYNNALVGTEQTMTANTNVIHGLFSTYSGNSFVNFTVFPRGNGGEYAALDAYIA